MLCGSVCSEDLSFQHRAQLRYVNTVVALSPTTALLRVCTADATRISREVSWPKENLQSLFCLARGPSRENRLVPVATSCMNALRSVLSTVERLSHKQPALTNAVSGFVLAGAGDALTQLVRARASRPLPCSSLQRSPAKCGHRGG